MLRVFALVIALVCFARPAAADPFDFTRTTAFGDSLSDNGNLANNIPPNAGPPFLPGYFNGRFSNGPTWIELLSDPSKSTNPDSSMNRFWAGVGFGPPFDVGGNVNNVNAAIGGAETVSGAVPSVQTQIGAFIAAGGVFGPRDLVSIQGGANDFFAFFDANPAPTASDISSFAATTGLNEASNVALAIGAGAKTILVSNLPNFGATPSFNGSPLTAQAGAFASATYNAALDHATEQLAALNPGVNLVQMDWFSALNVVVANPAAFGFTNVTTPCFTGVSICANPDSFLFWDNVHPTEAGHELLARYAALLLSTEETGQAVAELGHVALAMRLEASDIIFRRGLSPSSERPGGLYAELVGQTGSFDGNDTRLLGNTGVDFSVGGVRVGFDASEGAVSFGGSLAYQTGDVSGALLNSNLYTGQLDAYVLTRYSALFAGLEAGVSLDEFNDIDRAVGFPTVKADGGTQSIDYTVAATLGAQYQLGGLILTPAVRLGYAWLNIDGFTESAPILALEYGDRDVTTAFWTARLRASSPLFGARALTGYGEVGYEGLFSTDDSYTAKLAFNTAHAVTIDDDLEARGFYLKAGVGGAIDGNMRLSGEYGLSLQNGDGEVHSGRLRLTIPLSGGAPLGE